MVVKKIKKYFHKKTFIVIALLGLVGSVAMYVNVYQSYVEKTETLQDSNRELEKELAVLEGYHRNLDTYKQGIKDAGQAVQNILEEYPADAREEDVIMLAVKMQEENDITYKSINMEDQEGVYTVTYDVIESSGFEGLDGEVTFAQKHATYVNVTTYEELKECIELVYKSDNRIGIDNIVYCKNEELGTLEGNISLYFYSVSGTGKKYTAPDIAEYLRGTKDLFQAGR